MKWVFYIFGVLIFMVAPKELIPGAVGLIVIGVAFHINDIKEDILAHIEKNTESLRFDHRQLKKDIKDLEIKK